MTLSPTKLQELNYSDMIKLKKDNNKDQLIGYIQVLRGKVEELESYKLIAQRVQLLERSHLQSLQYNRRESIEIHGVPQAIRNDKLETYCLDLLQDIGCGEIKEKDVHACHRMRKKENTIIRFVNRKHADLALHNRRKLKDIDKSRYEIPIDSYGLFINESLCKPMQFLSYKVRSAYKSKDIESYNLWKGKLSLKLNGSEHRISHIDDLIDLGLAVEEDRLLFLK